MLIKHISIVIVIVIVMKFSCACLLLCGGEGQQASKSCLTLKDRHWQKTHDLLFERTKHIREGSI